MSTSLDAVRHEVAAARGLDAQAARFVHGETVEELEDSADRLASLLNREPTQARAAVPDLFSTATKEKAARNDALVAMFSGRQPQQRDEAGRYASGFDGGARRPLPAPGDPEREHGELVNRLAADSKLGRSGF
jgi:hypothetical protein